MGSLYVVLLQEMGKGAANIHKRAFNLLALLEVIFYIFRLTRGKENSV